MTDKQKTAGSRIDPGTGLPVPNPPITLPKPTPREPVQAPQNADHPDAERLAAERLHNAKGDLARQQALAASGESPDAIKARIKNEEAELARASSHLAVERKAGDKVVEAKAKAAKAAAGGGSEGEEGEEGPSPKEREEATERERQRREREGLPPETDGEREDRERRAKATPY